MAKDIKDLDFNKGLLPDEIKEREEVLIRASERLALAQDYWRYNYLTAEEDVSYIFGLQEEERTEDDNRLLLIFNLLPQFINRVVGGQRSITYRITVHPTGDALGRSEPVLTTVDGRELKLSEVLQDLIRDIEYSSDAIAHYKSAFKQALEGGIGWLRVLTEYEQDGFNLVPRIKNIQDRWSVYVDPDAKEPDLSDMNWAFIIEKIPKKQFERLYPSAMHNNVANPYFTTWVEGEYVLVAEYFERVRFKEKIYLMNNGDVIKEDKLKEYKDTGFKVVKSRTQERAKVLWWKISGTDVLEGAIEFPTSTIPIVPVLGRITYLKGKLYVKSLINDAKNTQRAFNRIMSSALETVDMYPSAPFIASDKAIEGYEDLWANANIMRTNILFYNEGYQPPRREPAPQVPSAQLNLMPVLEHTIQGQTGLYAASLGDASNERTGVAIRMRQTEGDIGTYEFIDNYALAIRRVGKLLVELIPRIYDTNRIVVLRGYDNSIQKVELNKVLINPATNKPLKVNTLQWNKWVVSVEAGKTYNTKREENAEQILRLMQYNPQVAQLGSDLLVKNLDFSDSDILAERLRKAIPIQFLSPQERMQVLKEQAEIQQQMQQFGLGIQQPDPEQIKEQLKVEIEKLKLQQQQLKLQYEQIKSQMSLALQKAKGDIQLAHQQFKTHSNIAMSEDRRRDMIAQRIADNIKQEGGI